jgi:hypothetical protein
MVRKIMEDNDVSNVKDLVSNHFIIVFVVLLKLDGEVE